MMINSIRHRLLLPTTPSPHGLVFFLLKPHTNPSSPRSLSSSSSSSSSSSTTPDPATLTYLIDSCGLSPEYAIVAARKRPPLRSTENPDAVLRLLRDYGLDETDISRIITKDPALLSLDSRAILRPKLEAFRSFGFSGESLVRVLTAHPVLLKRSLANHIIPCFTFLRTLLAAEGDLASVFSREPQGLNSGLDSVILPVLGVLRSKLVKILPRILILPPRRVNEIVEEVKAAGVLPADLAFIYAIRAFCAEKRANWHRKIAAFQSSGLSAAYVASSFRRPPVGHADVGGQYPAKPRVSFRPAEVGPGRHREASDSPQVQPGEEDPSQVRGGECFKEEGEVGTRLEHHPGAEDDHQFVLEEIRGEVSGRCS